VLDLQVYSLALMLEAMLFVALMMMLMMTMVVV
jgi:hypothetical protein